MGAGADAQLHDGRVDSHPAGNCCYQGAVKTVCYDAAKVQMTRDAGPIGLTFDDSYLCQKKRRIRG